MSGPTGDRDSSNGELPVLDATCCTSWSRLLDSFLSSPASLPANSGACHELGMPKQTRKAVPPGVRGIAG